MRILLDENFPIQLYRRLKEAGHDAEHIITLGLRGVSDDAIRRRLATETDLLFLTQDTEFFELPLGTAAIVMISRVPKRSPSPDASTCGTTRSTTSFNAPSRAGSSSFSATDE